MDILDVLKKDLSQPLVDLGLIEIYRTDSTVPSYSGPGYLSRDSEGQLKVKCYSHGSDREIFESINSIQPGQLIPQSEYYNLVLSDFYGKKWVTNSALLDFSSGAIRDQLVVEAHINQLTYSDTTSLDFGAPTLNVFFNTDVEIPGNALLETEVKVRGERRASSRGLRAATFRSCGYEFEIGDTRDVGRSILVVKPSDAIPSIGFSALFCSQVCDALTFVLGQEIGWAKCAIYGGHTETITINAPVSIEIRKSNSPVPTYGPRHAEDVWNLFDCFLKYIYLQENEGRHRIAAYVHQIIRSEDAVLELQCLVVAVAVEGLLKTEFETSDNADHIRESISQLTMAIDGTSVADEVKKRAIGAISGLRTTRPYDKLLELSERDLIPLEEVRAWKALRNSATHADKFGGSNFQEYLNKYYQVLTLFNRLVFLKIGYVGHFTNYGKYEGQSWLVQKFGNRIQTEENKK